MKNGTGLFHALLLLLIAVSSASAKPFDEGMALYKQGQYEEAIKAFQSSLDSGTTRADRRVLYLFMGKSYESAGRLDKAVSAYEEALQYDRKNWRRHRDLGGLYEKTELNWKALGCYKEAIELSPHEPILFLALGRVYRKVGLYSDAIFWMDKALDARKDEPEVLSELSHIYEGQGRFEEAAFAAKMSDKVGTRLIYLAVLAGNAGLAKEGVARLGQSGVSKETRQAYENLVQLLQLPPKEILAGKSPNTALQKVLKSPFNEGMK